MQYADCMTSLALVIRIEVIRDSGNLGLCIRISWGFFALGIPSFRDCETLGTLGHWGIWYSMFSAVESQGIREFGFGDSRTSLFDQRAEVNGTQAVMERNHTSGRRSLKGKRFKHRGSELRIWSLGAMEVRVVISARASMFEHHSRSSIRYSRYALPR